jgi:hypothetical protein
MSFLQCVENELLRPLHRDVLALQRYKLGGNLFFGQAAPGVQQNTLHVAVGQPLPLQQARFCVVSDRKPALVDFWLPLPCLF